MKNNANKNNVRYMINLMNTLMKENKITFDKRAKKIGIELLEQNITDKQRKAILNNLDVIVDRKDGYYRVEKLERKGDMKIKMGEDIMNDNERLEQKKDRNPYVLELKNLIEEKNFEEAKKYIDTIKKDNKILPEIIFELQMQLTKGFRTNQDFQDAKLIIQDILSEEGLTDKQINTVQIELMIIAVEENKPEQAEWIGEYMLENSNLSLEEEFAIQSKLVKIEMKQKNYEVAEERIEKMLQNKELTPKQEIRTKSQLIALLTAEGDYIRAQEVANEILNEETVSDGAKKTFQTQLEKINAIISRIEENNKVKNKKVFEEKIYDRFNNGVFLTREDIEIVENSAIAEYYDEEISKYGRYNLYDGKINTEDLEELIEENKETLAGNMFIAEAYDYFNLSHLGIKRLKDYKNINSSLSENEIKSIKQAIGLIEEKCLPIAKREKWNKIYMNLAKEKQMEDEER